MRSVAFALKQQPADEDHKLILPTAAAEHELKGAVPSQDPRLPERSLLFLSPNRGAPPLRGMSCGHALHGVDVQHLAEL